MGARVKHLLMAHHLLDQVGDEDLPQLVAIVPIVKVLIPTTPIKSFPPLMSFPTLALHFGRDSARTQMHLDLWLKCCAAQ